MKVFPMPNPVLRSYTRIGKIIPHQHLTLFTGLPAVGKSYTLFKFLNMNSVSPLWFNLDEDPALLQFDFMGMTSDNDTLTAFINLEIEDLSNAVVVIDTYSRLVAELKADNNEKFQREITERLLIATKHYKSTIIVLGHPADYVGKSSIFTDNPSLVRDCHEHLHIDKLVSSSKKMEDPLYRFYINKGRGIGGTQIIDNWMREPAINPLTKQIC